MPITVPTIDDRSYQAILAEATARIPIHNPQWTNFNDSDPGMTLVQLFAFMTESLLYRANRIPDRNRSQFLTLLGVTLRPASAAEGLVTFDSLRGAPAVYTLPDSLTVYAGNVPFRTLDGLDVLPIEAAVYYKRPTDTPEATLEAVYEDLYAGLLASGAELDYYETTPLEQPLNGAAYPVVNLADTQDGSLWVALLAREAELVDSVREMIAQKTLTLGILPALTEAERVLLPAGTEVAALSSLIFQRPQVAADGRLPDPPAPRIPEYATIPSRLQDDLLARPGIVELQLPDLLGLRLWSNLEPTEAGTGDFPPAVEDTDISERIITWVRIRLKQSDAQDTTPAQLRGRISWVGVNAARIVQRAHVFAEDLGRGSGEPDQSVTLINTPVIRDSVTLIVDGEPWEEVADLLAAPPEVPVASGQMGPGLIAGSTAVGNAKVFSVNYESGEIRCGDGAHGARWPAGARLRASYDYGGGVEGNVGIGAITKSSELPSGVKVTNPIRTWGGAEAESLDHAQQRIPLYLQHRDRLVTHEDFEEIVQETPGVEIGRAEVVPLVYPDQTDIDAPGVVTVVVIPKYDLLHPNAPRPDLLFLDAVCAHLEPRRLITTELHVVGPEYVPIWISVGVEVVPGQATGPIREAVKGALRTFLSPLTGGFDGQGWPLGKTVERLELWATASRVAGVAAITAVLLSDDSGVDNDRVRLARLALPELAGIEVAIGEPVPLASLIGEIVTGETPPATVAVPLIEVEC